MSERYSVPCDRCGKRLDQIYEKCPNCGEIIKARIDPTFQNIFESKKARPHYLRPILILASIVGDVFLVLTIFALFGRYFSNPVGEGAFISGALCMFLSLGYTVLFIIGFLILLFKKVIDIKTLLFFFVNLILLAFVNPFGLFSLTFNHPWNLLK